MVQWSHPSQCTCGGPGAPKVVKRAGGIHLCNTCTFGASEEDASNEMVVHAVDLCNISGEENAS